MESHIGLDLASTLLQESTYPKFSMCKSGIQYNSDSDEEGIFRSTTNDKTHKESGMSSKKAQSKLAMTRSINQGVIKKEQLKKLFERTPEQVEEEQTLLTELRKIEQRKKERDRKTQDLQKLITAADHQADSRKSERKSSKKSSSSSRNRPNKTDTAHAVESAGIKFPDFKNSGVTLRSQRIKLPSSLGQKKMKGIEQMLNELRLELNPPPTEQICQQFNELRSLQSLRHQYEALAPGKTLTIPPALLPKTEPEVKADIIDVVASPSTPSITH
ncbi:hypothetical protein PUN28_006112 [Cardiocondyla obscurior]|uniref:DNA methyltransferase 1-associated 1 domain-containing protein n=1 Tax=Cardiocondyla obscurior TaxID=286306 RepID=A0AAW2GCM8_9HYME